MNILAVVLGVLVLAGCTSGGADYNNSSRGVSAPGPAIVALEGLPIKGRAPKTGYNRDQFGPAWADIDLNGCDTRNDILARDLDQETVEVDSCTVETGVLRDPYTATSVPFQRGTDTSRLVQIDHVVALGDAWQKGAQQLSPDERLYLANDPINLLATTGSINASKSDSDAASWLPPNRDFRCAYVARQIAVKQKYRLWVTQAERDAMAGILSTCPSEPLVTSN
jgi:hypothetical protein